MQRTSIQRIVHGYGTTTRHYQWGRRIQSRRSIELQKKRYSTQFLVYWKGYRNKHDQWIVKTGLPHAKEMIQEYWANSLR